MRSHRKLFFLLAFLLIVLKIIFYQDKLSAPIPDGKNENISEYPIDLEFIPPFREFVVDFYTARNYKLTACLIRKSMSQLLFNTMCLLHDPVNFGNHYLNETWNEIRPCEYQEGDPFSEFPQDLRHHSDFTRIVFVRDPFERFISLYLDKCVREKYCWDCGDDMRCVLREIYQSMQNHSSSKSQVASFMDKHTAPTTWFCDFYHYLKKFTVIVIGVEKEQRIASMNKLRKLLEKKNVPDAIISKIVNETINGNTSHSTHKSLDRQKAMKQIQEDEVVREYLHKIYFYDYAVFPFNRDHLDEKYQGFTQDVIFRKKYREIFQLQDEYENVLS